YGVLKKEGSLYLKQNIDILLEQGGYEARSPMMLNQLGYGLLEEEMFQDAIEVFRINTELYPEEANPWDSLAEAYLKSGDKKTALKFYRKALEIDPELPSAKEMVGALE
ncbi:MAG: tetratricopeptide repeat protein, partial [Phaeodactylibacter sp.]|nr:tetratricopeptide repeat protein [Phaeodactylibacter sp.]